MYRSLRKRLYGLKVGQKISLGYALALGIAVSGTVAGFGIGNHYQQQAEARKTRVRNEVEILHRLQSRVLQTRTHQQQLIPLVQDLERFQDEYAHLLKHKDEIADIWAELNAFVAEPPSWQNQAHQAQILDFLQTYNRVPQRYSLEVDQRVERVRQLNLNLSADVNQAQSLILEFTNSDLALEFDGISDDLVGLLDQSYQQLEAAIELHEEAGKVAEQIVVISIILSVAIAILLALLTSRAISHPIQTLTQIAQRSTEESNFDLQVTIEQDDEIGTLAHAFNQLICSVKKLLSEQKAANEQLEIYNQTLAVRVEARTQEINEKNAELQQALEELQRAHIEQKVANEKLEVYNQTLEMRVDKRTREISEKNKNLQKILAKLQRTHIQMVQNEKMSSLGKMVAGIAHEINNPINFIHGNLTHVQEYTFNLLRFIDLYQKFNTYSTPEIQAMQEEIDLDFIKIDLPKILDSMKIGTDRICQIVLSLRNFSRMDEAEFKAVDIHEGINSTLLILQHNFKNKSDFPDIKVIRDYGNLPLVECYPSQLNQAFMNILANAIDALDEANEKRTCQEIKENPSRITIQTSLVSLDWVKISILDNGIGMPESVIDQIFDPFFTTKSIGKGTGMGMSISYQIITEKHHGKLDCFSVPGRGTEFVIQIPARQQSHKAA